MISVCFVCLGNICRSPTAEGIFIDLVTKAGLQDQIRIDSAGTSGWNVDMPPDPRSFETAQRRGVHLPSRARQFSETDFQTFDWIIAMDKANLEAILAMAPTPAAKAKVHLLRSFDPAASPNAEVPDPYYGGPQGFEHVFDMCEAACKGLLKHIIELK